MADNVQLNTGSGGAVLATDDVGGVHYQIVKQAFGVLDSATLVSSANPLPVTVGSAALPAGNNNIGDVDVASLPALPAGTNNIGDVDVLSLPALPAGNNNIGDVDIASHVPGTGATNLGKAEDAVHGSGDTGVMCLAVRRDADTSLVDATGDYAPLQVNANGQLKVTSVTPIPAGTNNIGDVDVLTLPALPAGTNNIGDVDIASIAAGDNNIGNVDIVSLPSLPSGNNNIGDVDVASLPALPSGNNNIGDVDVASLPALPSGTNNIGNVGIIARTSGGCTPYKNLDVDESEDDVKTSSGQLFFIHAMNLANAKRYLKIYDGTAATVTVGSTTPAFTFALPTQGDTNGAGFTLPFPCPVTFANGICIAATTGFADVDTGAPGTNEIIVNLGYA